MIEKLIKKYFDKNSSPEEKKSIYESLIDSPSEYTQYFSEEEWNAFIDSNEKGREHEAELLNRKYKTANAKRIVFYKRMGYAAASVIILFLSFWMIKVYFPNKQPQISARKFTESPGLIVRFNASPVAEKIVLSDSSVVELSAGSKISYLRNFEPGRRTIQLEGTAIFKIFKNPKRPFTVFCKEVATTALGTKFRVSNSKSGKVLVELMEGKILVRRSGKEENNRNEQYYLVAGDVISFDRPKNMFTKYSTIANNEDKAPSTASGNRKPASLPKNVESLSDHRIETESSIQFNGEMLPKVLDYMSVVYKVKIIYPTKYISRIRFVGSVRKNENIHQILQNIAIMNELQLKQDTANNVFIIQIPSK